ncbi:LysR family transcriptional regulator [Hyphomonas sp.]|uniref:LysR family transcriptional regulator n=1 Tax=Hyphomonas sp. TaxID=87 RepID=UPI00391D58E6
MATPTHLRSFQALELALRLGSLKSAADELGITPAAVGQRIKALEDFLEMELLVRGRAGLQPTALLAVALPNLTRAFRELDAVVEILDMRRGHEIHIAAKQDFADLWLRPRLGNIRSALPNISFCVNGEGDAPHRLGPADCEIRFGAPKDGHDVLFADYIVPISSPENDRRISTLSKLDRLEGFPLLHLDAYKDDPAVEGWAAWIKANKMRRTAPERGIRFQRISAVLEAVLADAGLTLCGLGLISDLVSAGRIAAPFGLEGGSWTSHAYFARFRPDALHRPQVRRFRDWLVAEAQTTKSQLTRLASAN